ncbi:hypothetical protein PFAS1_27330 [Pseudomonas frederiksbergensis]|nr:hypothetical protein PFAS1_27330 [Pseudomonas frederiksbergensis]
MTPITLELEDEFTHLTLAPELGGSIVNWSVRGTGLPLLRGLRLLKQGESAELGFSLHYRYPSN